MTEQPRWWALALCAEIGAEGLFFPEDGDLGQVALAKQVCASCEVRVECLEDALATAPHWDRYGIRAGTSARERARMRLERKQVAA